MNITVRLLNQLGDEVGDLRLESVRVADAGVETQAPDLGGQMSRVIDRLDAALGEMDLAPILYPLGMRIAVSRALLTASPDGVSIPLQIRPLAGAAGGRTALPNAGRAQDAAGSGGEMDDLFSLGGKEEPGLSGSRQASPDADGARRPDLGANGAADPNRREELDQWTELGDMWDMGDEGGRE